MIYERIKKLREKQGYTQTELAKMLGVTRSCVNAWEMGISVPSTQSLVRGFRHPHRRAFRQRHTARTFDRSAAEKRRRAGRLTAGSE